MHSDAADPAGTLEDLKRQVPFACTLIVAASLLTASIAVARPRTGWGEVEVGVGGLDFGWTGECIRLGLDGVIGSRWIKIGKEAVAVLVVKLCSPTRAVFECMRKLAFWSCALIAWRIGGGAQRGEGQGRCGRR